MRVVLAVLIASTLFAQSRVIVNPFPPGSGLEYIPTPTSGPGSGSSNATIAAGTGIVASGAACTPSATGTCTITNTSVLTPIIPGSPDTLNCNTTSNITTAPQPFATTWTMPAFTQVAGASFGLDYDLIQTTPASATSISLQVNLDSTPIYSSLNAAQTVSLTGLPGSASFRIGAPKVGASGSVLADATSVLSLTPTQFLNRAVAPILLNGNFASSATWVLGAGWTISGGFAVATAVTGATITQVLPVVAGVAYTVTYTVTNYSGTGQFAATIGAASGTTHSANGTYVDVITGALSGSLSVGITGVSALNASFSNFSLTAAALNPAIDTTVSHTISLLMQCNTNTAGNQVELKATRPYRIY